MGFGIVVVSFALSTRRWPIAFGLGRARRFRLFLCLDPRVGVGLVASVLRAGGFVCLSNFGLCLIFPRRVGFSLSRFSSVLVVRSVVSFYYPVRLAPGVGFSMRKVENSCCILVVFR